MSKLMSNLQEWFATLSERERRLTAFAGLAATVFLVFLVMFTSANTANAIRLRTQTKITQLAQIQSLATGYREQKAAQEAVEQQLANSNVRLASFLEQQATDTGVPLPSITPKPDQTLEGTKIIESVVELTVTDVKLSRLIEFMNRIESGPGMVKIKNVRLEPRVAQENVTAWLSVATYHTKG